MPIAIGMLIGTGQLAPEDMNDIAIVGDAFARPMLNALEAAKAAGKPYDVSSLKVIISSGVMFSREVSACSRSIPPTTLRNVVIVSCSMA